MRMATEGIRRIDGSLDRRNRSEQMRDLLAKAQLDVDLVRLVPRFADSPVVQSARQ